MSFEIDPNKQYFLAGDISASMERVDGKTNGVTRYQYMLEKFKQFIQVSQDFDPDGPTVLLFGEKVQVFENTNLEAVSAKLSNPSFEGWTNTDLLIKKADELHRANKAKDPNTSSVLLIFTDGAPTNRKATEQAIRDRANANERDDEFSIAVLTVGEIDPDLQGYLKALDDELQGVKFDIVDVKKLEEVDFLAAVAGAIND